MIKISPSILSSDFSKLGEEVRRMEKSGANMIHVDVMDGHFVPNLTLGAPIVKSIRDYTKLPFDVHLMISEPLKYISDFAQAGSDIITIHLEADSDIAETVEKIHLYGKKAGLSIKPKTPAEMIFPYLNLLDMVLVMTVEPGFGGQSFMPAMLPKIREIKKEIDRRNLLIDIEVDGGINLDTIRDAAKAGADVFVAGSAVFGAENPKKAIKQLRTTAIGDRAN